MRLVLLLICSSLVLTACSAISIGEQDVFFPKPSVTPQTFDLEGVRLADTTLAVTDSVDVDPVLRTESNVEQVRALEAPLLVVAGAEDNVTDPAMARRLHREAGSQEKQLLVVEDGGHNGLAETDAVQKAITTSWSRWHRTVPPQTQSEGNTRGTSGRRVSPSCCGVMFADCNCMAGLKNAMPGAEGDFFHAAPRYVPIELH